MKNLFIKLFILLTTVSVLTACGLFGIEKIIIRKSDFTHTEEDILSKGKLLFLYNPQGEQITYPIIEIEERVSTSGFYYSNRGDEQKHVYLDTTVYQPSIIILTRGRFIVSMGCTVNGKISKVDKNSFTIDYFEDSLDCSKINLNKNQTLVYNTLKACNRCKVENKTIYFYKNELLMMAFSVV